MAEQKILKFPSGFLWGVSTSAYQIEGGITNDWSEWEKSELRIKNLELRNLNPRDFICGQACDSYNRYEEDLDLVKKLGCGAFRLGVEWARIEPVEGKFNQAEIEHYKEVLRAAKKRDLQVILTLWHWTNPIWLAEQGGWANRKAVDYFIRYVELIVKKLGQDVDFWITLNEPMAHLGFGYLRGNFPPARRGDLIGLIKAYKNLVKAHKLAYKKIQQIQPQSKVSFTSLTDYFEPANKYNPLDWLIVIIARYWHHRKFLNETRNYIDFIAFDYYFHQRLSWLPPFKANFNYYTNDMGWEIYPAGIYCVIKYLTSFKKPIYVMENGIADAADKKRIKFIVDHLKHIHRSISEGADVRGYLYWSLLDNFEWAHGWAPKFGLYTMDRRTFKRTPRPSVALYSEICRNNRILI